MNTFGISELKPVRPCNTLLMESVLSQDPVKEGEAKIKADFDQLLEDMSAAFRNIED